MQSLPENARGEGEDDLQREEEIEEELHSPANGPTHHPSAPPGELFDIATTVDPSYIISLIRKLLPAEGRQGDACVPATGNNTSEGSQTSHTEDGAMSLKRNGGLNGSNGHIEAMEIECDDLERSSRSAEHSEKLAREEVWEESGCVLWDLAANKEHAEFMVQNLVLDVLLANLLTSDSARIREISLGIIGNLACHEVLMNQITSSDRLLETIVAQVFSDDAPCLCEACRLLAMGLQGCQSILWIKSLQSEDVLSRVLWIAENTLNPVLIEKSVGLLLAIMESQDALPALLPTLMKLGLPALLVTLLGFEMEKLTGDRIPERYPALDSVLRAIEALSVIDEYSEEICSNKEVAHMAVELIKIPEKIEISSSCVTAAVLLANILADDPDLAFGMSKDLILLQSLLDLLPFTSDDLEARTALWSILARALCRVKETEMSSCNLSQFVWMLVSRSDLIEDILLDNEWDRSFMNTVMPAASEARLNSRTAAIKCILNILNQWKLVKDGVTEGHNDEDPVNIADDGDVQKLIECFHRHAG